MSAGLDSATAVTSSTILQNFSNQGFRFYGRYLVDKYAMTKAEAKAISAYMNVVTLFERDLKAVKEKGYYTTAQGTTDALEAIATSKALGQPGNTTIYFTVDYDASSAEITSNIIPYFKAVKSILDNTVVNTSNYKMGVYGGKSVLWAVENICPYRWRVNNSWGNGNGSPAYTNYNISQDNFNVTLNGVLVDINTSNGTTGGWSI